MDRDSEKKDALDYMKLPQIEYDALTEEEAKEFVKIEQRFIKAYHDKTDNDTKSEWLEQQLYREMPDKTRAEVTTIAQGIKDAISEMEVYSEEVNTACDAGVSAEAWFAKKVSESSSGMSVMEFGNYLQAIDDALAMGNAQMERTILTKTGDVSQCVNLDGFIAEQYAVNSFNRKAVLENSNFLAEVKVPEPGETYGLNSFDVVIKDKASGKVVHQYQFKYGKDAKATIRMLKDGNYNNQRFVVPEGQVEEVRKAFPGKSVESHIGGTEQVGTKSDSLTKEQAKEFQNDVQQNEVMLRQDWNDYNVKDVAFNVGRQATLMGVQSMAVITGFSMVEKMAKGEEIEADEVVAIALKNGTDTWIKEATAGAMKVAVDKGVIKFIPPGTPAGTLAKMAYVAVEDVKILYRVATGDMTVTEGIDSVGRTTVAMAVGLGWAAKGAVIGASVMGLLPVVGPLAGGLIGGTLGYIAGSGIGQAVYNGAKKLGKAVASVAKHLGRAVKSRLSRVTNGVKGFFRR